MWKVFAGGLAAIAALVAGSVAVIVVVTRDGPVRPAGQREAEATRPQADGGFGRDARAVEASETITYGAPPPTDPAPPPAPAAKVAPPRDSWEAVPVSARAKSLGRMGGAVAASLNELHDDLATCFTADAQAAHAADLVSRVRDASPMDDAATIVLMLQLEGGQDGTVRVVDAPLEARGGAGDELIACAQSKLRGKVLNAPGAKPGARYRLLHQLLP